MKKPILNLKMKTPILLILLLFILLLSTVKVKATSDPYYNLQAYLNAISFQAAWYSPYNSEGAGVTVAVIDTGINLNHEDLMRNLWTNKKEIPNNGIDDDNNGYIDDYYGFNFITNDASVLAYTEHGTMVAGIIAAEKDNNKGITGIAPKAKIMTVVAGDSNGSFSPANVNKAIRYAADNGADIINLSLGTPGIIYLPFGQNTYEDAIQYAYSKNKVIVVAAGNGDYYGAGQNLNLNMFPQYPVCNNKKDGIDRLLGVYAIDFYAKWLTTWSSYGDNCTNIGAIGEAVVSTSHPMFSQYGDYDIRNGTSFAAPQVAGAAALLKSYNLKLNNWEIIEILKSSAELLPDGSKLLDIGKAFNLLDHGGLNDFIPVIKSIGYNTGNQKMIISGNYLRDGMSLTVIGPNNSIQVVPFTQLKRNDLSYETPINLSVNQNYSVYLTFHNHQSNTYNLSTIQQSQSSTTDTNKNTPVSTPPKNIKDGDLIQLSKTPGIYLIDGSLKRPIKSLWIFNSRGYKQKNVKIVKQDVFDYYDIGNDVGAPQIKVNVNKLTVRVKPSLLAKITDSILKNETYGTTNFQNGWYELTTKNNKTGWVINKYIDIVFGDAQHLRRSKPTVTRTNLDSTILSDGTLTLFKFNIASDVSGDITVKKLRFDITVNDVSGSGLSVTNWTLYDASDMGTAFRGNWGDGSISSNSGVITEMNGAHSLYFVFNTEKVVAAGGSENFVLKANVTGSAQHDSLLTRLGVAHDTAPKTGVILADSGDNLLNDLSEDGKTPINVDFLWSDGATGVWHDYHNYSSGALHKDWTNGYLVKGLPTNYSSLSR